MDGEERASRHPGKRGLDSSSPLRSERGRGGEATGDLGIGKKGVASLFHIRKKVPHACHASGGGGEGKVVF